MVEPGEIYWADLDQAGRRPIIVISREELNRGAHVLAVVCTSSRLAMRSLLPNFVFFQAGQFGFSKDCVAQCEQLIYLDKTQLDPGGPFGQLDDLTLRDVIKAIGYVMDSDCEPL